MAQKKCRHSFAEWGSNLQSKLQSEEEGMPCVRKKGVRRDFLNLAVEGRADVIACKFLRTNLLSRKVEMTERRHHEVDFWNPILSLSLSWSAFTALAVKIAEILCRLLLGFPGKGKQLDRHLHLAASPFYRN